MKARFPLLLTVLIAVGMAAPGAVADDKGKAKDKKDKKDKVERSDQDADRRDGRDHDDDDRDGNGRITICHIPPGNPGARHTITVSESAWDAHRKHGDRRGACDRPGNDRRRFEDLDRNRDGWLSRAEWPFGREAFDRTDRTPRDDRISPEEYGRY
jgi:hypothetical protein